MEDLSRVLGFALTLGRMTFGRLTFGRLLQSPRERLHSDCINSPCQLRPRERLYRHPIGTQRWNPS